MHRKVHKIGSSLMIALPSSWVKNQKVEQNSEVFIKEGTILRISKQEQIREQRTLSISLKQDAGLLRKKAYLRSLLGNIYKLGYDKVILEDVSESLKKPIRDTCQNLIGFEIIKEDESIITIKNLANPVEENQLIKKQFFATKTIMDLMQDDIRNDSRANASEINEYAKIVERSSDFTKRLTLKKNTEKYLLIWTFEKLNQELLYLYSALPRSKKEKIFVASVFDYVRQSLDNVYNFKRQTTIQLQKQKDQLLYDKGPKLLRTKNPQTIHHAMNLVRRAWDAVGPTLLFSVEKMTN